eukprot:13014912-Alexandrium_andersonii.AAC.1
MHTYAPIAAAAHLGLRRAPLRRALTRPRPPQRRKPRTRPPRPTTTTRGLAPSSGPHRSRSRGA